MGQRFVAVWFWPENSFPTMNHIIFYHGAGDKGYAGPGELGQGKMYPVLT